MGKLKDLGIAFRQSHSIVAIIYPIPLEQIFFSRPQRIICYYCELCMALSVMALFIGAEQEGNLGFIKTINVSVISALFMIPISHVVPWMFQVAQTITSFTVLERQRVKREYEAKVREFNHNAEEAINTSLNLGINELHHQVIERVQLGKKQKSHSSKHKPHKHRHKHKHRRNHRNKSKVAPDIQNESESLRTIEDIVQAVHLPKHVTDGEFVANHSHMARAGTQMHLKDIDSSDSGPEKSPVPKKKRRRRRRRRYHLPGTDKLKGSDEENPYTDVLTGVDLGDPAPTVDIIPRRVGPTAKKKKKKRSRAHRRAVDTIEEIIEEIPQPPETISNVKITSLSDTTSHFMTAEKAAVAIQRNWRRQMAVRRRAINRILAVIRGKQGHNRALRMRELQDFKSKAMQIPRYILIGIVYSVILFLTLFCIYLNLIFGIKFTLEEQYAWVTATYLATFLDWVVYSTSKIILQWLLPPYVTECFFVLCVAGVVLFGVFCGQIMGREPWAQDFEIICDVLPW